MHADIGFEAVGALEFGVEQVERLERAAEAVKRGGVLGDCDRGDEEALAALIIADKTGDPNLALDLAARALVGLKLQRRLLLEPSLLRGRLLSRLLFRFALLCRLALDARPFGLGRDGR